METAWHRIDYKIFERLVTAAQNHFARQSRWVDPDAVPEKTIVDWLHDLEQDRVTPSPTPEPGDLLVKQARGEQWMLTSGGWRELAPLELQAAAMSADEIEAVVAQGGTVQARKGFTFGDHEQRDPFPPGAPREFQDGDPMMQPVAGVAPRDWGRSVVEDELDRLRGTPRREFAPVVKRCLADLLELENAIDVTLEATADTDLAAGASNTLRSFKDGVDTSRKLLLDTATRDLRSQP